MASELGSPPEYHRTKHFCLTQPSDRREFRSHSPSSSLLTRKAPNSIRVCFPTMAQAAIAVPSSIQAYLNSQNQRSRHASKHRFFIVELSQALFDFVIQLLPTPEEMAVKEDVRKLLERLIHTIEPDSRLLSFGSTANGFSLRNSGWYHSSCHCQQR